MKFYLIVKIGNSHLKVLAQSERLETLAHSLKEITDAGFYVMIIKADSEAKALVKAASLSLCDIDIIEIPDIEQQGKAITATAAHITESKEVSNECSK
ncbi:hypothetical protein [uncultured Helicobacter sp.]|uniref:hypothetical protein n=1 Tax=uncultured Helicobacter sp. TaxID=175537 RepID=UPI00262EA0AC|nr:hypothetical protein [uncultured Helicobacter sp.]